MMKNILSLSFVSIVSILSLSACGSKGAGGGGGEHTITIPVPTLPTITRPSVTQKTESARILTTPDGDKYTLEISPRGWVTVKTKSGEGVGYNQDKSFYGAWVDDSKQFRQYLYQGSAATNIPNTGKAVYVGNVVRASAMTSGEIYNAGTSRLNVDFGARTVDGYLDLDVARDVTLKTGKLDGAKFSGQASVLGNSGGKYEGALFGEGATEMGGMVEFKNNSELNAVFGGKRY